MTTSDEIKRKALELSEKTDSNSITPKEVGGIMHDLASLGENAIRNGGTLGIRKVYESVAAMEADSISPVDLWGNPIKKGNLVVIYDGTSSGVDNNKIYAFMKPGWQIATHLDAGYATKASLDAAIENILLQFRDSENALNESIGNLEETVTGNKQEVDAKLSELGSEVGAISNIISRFDLSWNSNAYYNKNGEFTEGGGHVIQASKKIDVTNYVGYSLALKIASPTNNDCFFLDEDEKIISNIAFYNDTTVITVPEASKYLVLTNTTERVQQNETRALVLGKNIEVTNTSDNNINIIVNGNGHIAVSEKNLDKRFVFLQQTTQDNMLQNFSAIKYGYYLTKDGTEASAEWLAYYTEYVKIPDGVTRLVTSAGNSVGLLIYNSDKILLKSYPTERGVYVDISELKDARYVRVNLNPKQIPTADQYEGEPFYLYFDKSQQVNSDNTIIFNNKSWINGITQYPTKKDIKISDFNKDINSAWIKGSVVGSKAVVVPSNAIEKKEHFKGYIRKVYENIVFAWYYGYAYYIYLGEDIERVGKIFKIDAQGNEENVDASVVELDSNYVRFVQVEYDEKNLEFKFYYLETIESESKLIKSWKPTQELYFTSGFAFSEGQYDASFTFYEKMVSDGSVLIEQEKKLEYGKAECLVGYNPTNSRFYLMDYQKNDNNRTYGNCINKPFKLEGKKAVFFGDSITAGVSSAPNWGVTTNRYTTVLSSYFGMIEQNIGVSGSSICNKDNDITPIVSEVNSYNGEADIVFIAGGTNDFGGSPQSPLGLLGDTTEDSFYGAMDSICRKLQTNYPNAIVFFITPINRTVESSDSQALYTLNDYRNAIFEVAVKYGFNVIDGSMFGFPTFGESDKPIKDLLLADGLHPTDIGHKFFAKCLSGLIG